ncbi:MAG: hypothetical protein ACYCWW_18585 [Deltaproteobacteria bacterium]
MEPELQLVEAEPDVVDAIERMRRRLYRRSSDRVICDLLEDDFFQARAALREVEVWIEGLLLALGDGHLGPEQLFDCADDQAPLERLDELVATVQSLRKRAALVAGRERLSSPR